MLFEHLIEIILNKFDIKIIKEGFQKIWIILHNQNIVKPSLISEKEAKNIVYSKTSTEVIKAIPFKNPKDNSYYIAALIRYKKDNRAYSDRINLFKKFGKTYTFKWESPSLRIYESFEVRDINNNGYKELIFSDVASGTGMWEKKMYIYSITEDNLFILEENMDYNELSSPFSPNISLNFNINSNFGKSIEKITEDYGFLNNKTLDLEDKKFAHHNWYAMNGNIHSGRIRLKKYNGKPDYSYKLHKKRIGKNFNWYSYNMGPLYGYNKSQNKHFVAFAPDFRAHYVRCINYLDEQKVYFSCFGDSRIYYFEYKETHGILKSFDTKINKIKDIQITNRDNKEKIKINNNFLINSNDFK